MKFDFHVDWIKKWARYTPGKLFLREHDRGREWTYSDFNKKSVALAAYLTKDLGLTKGDRIAVYSKNRAEYVLLFSACVKTGIILVPLNFRLTSREIDILLDDASPLCIFYEKEFEIEIEKIKNLTGIRHKLNIEILSQLMESDTPGDFEEIQFSEDDIVMILYTAGTTGLSKGAIISHKMLFWNAVNTQLRLDLNSNDHTQSFAPFFHTGGWNVLFTPFLHCGASHTILNKFEPELINRLIEKEKTTILFGVPTMLQMMADSSNFESTDFSSVRYAIVGGSAMPIPLIKLWHSKGVFIRQGYGLTEVGPNCFSLHQDDAIRKIGSIGFPNFYVDAKLIDDKGNKCTPGGIGELWLKSPVVTPGYWRKEKETKESITDGWFHTGDMMRFDEEGYYYVVDRKKNMFISGGENVYPAEIEKFLLTNSNIKETSVIGVPDEKWGETGAAFIVITAGSKLTPNEIFNYCKGNLAKYKIPKHILFVDEIPKNEAGKIDRKKLQDLYKLNTTNK